MTKTDQNNTDFDDFPMSPTGEQSGRKYFDSYLKTRDLIKQIPNKIKGADDAKTLWRLFKEVSSQSGEKSVFFRKHIDAKDALTTLWLSNIRSTAKFFIEFNKISEFKGINSEDLTRIARLSVDVDNIKLLPAILAEYGIVLIFEPYLPGMKLDGAVFSVEGRNAVICISLRFPRLDSLWFTLMHELAHVALHFEHLSTPIIDDFDEINEDLIEKEADKLALNSTISRSDWRNCEAKYDLTNEAVYAFSKRIGVHPAI